MAIVKFKKGFLMKELDLPWSALEDKIIGNGSGTIEHEIIFKYGDKFYRTRYSIGATEHQEDRPWDYEDEVECEEVHKVQKVVEVWEAV